MTNPLFGIIKTITMYIFNRFEFDTSLINKKIQMPDGSVFTIFRRVQVRTKVHSEPEAYFLVRFRPTRMSIEENIEFSKKTMMVFMGFSGFRSKYWSVDHNTGICQGLYEWQTVEDATNYSKSVAMKFMAERSDPETLMFRIIDKSNETLHYEITD